MVRLSHVGVISFAIWQSLTATVFGLLFGIVFGFFSLGTFGLSYGFTYILRWIFWTPIVFGAIGFLTTVMGGAIYNSLVRKKGGIILQFQDIKSDVGSRARLSRVSVKSAAIWQTLIATLVGLFLGIVFGFSVFLQFGLRYGFGYILRVMFLTPLVFGVIGFLATVISAAIYNSLVRNKGGLVLEFQEIKSAFELPPAPPEF